MSKVALAFGSFIVGALSSFLILSGIQTSIAAQSAFAEGGASSNPSPTVSSRGGGPMIIGGGLGVILPSLVPTVPGLGPTMTAVSPGPSAIQQLDGLDCTGCSFQSPLLTYGGGAFRLPGSHFEGAIAVTFNGPALNTFALLKRLGKIRETPENAAPPLYNPPKMEEATVKAEAKEPMTMTLVSPVGAR